MGGVDSQGCPSPAEPETVRDGAQRMCFNKSSGDCNAG